MSWLLLLSTSLLLTEVGAQTINFVKEDFADPTLPENQDLIVPEVLAITRGDNRSIYNALVPGDELNAGLFERTAPANTEWAFVKEPITAESACEVLNANFANF
jgi:hypothetical protein